MTKKAAASPSPKPRASASAGGTQSIARAALLMREVAAVQRQGARLVDLAQRVDLQRPTVHRILQALVAERWLQQRDDRRYYLGPAMLEFGLAAAGPFDLRSLCHPALTRLAHATEDTVFLTSRSGAEEVCIERLDGTFPIKVHIFNVGDRRPLGVGVGGLAVLAALPDELVRQAVRSGARRLSAFGGLSEKAMLARVKHTRSLGYALHDVPGVAGFRAVGLPIRDPAGRPIAGLSVSAIADRLEGARLQRTIALLRDEAQGIEKLLREPVTPGD